VRTTVEGEATLTKPRIDAPILDQTPTADQLTDYDRLHLITYIRLLDADTDGIPWEEASHSILHIDPKTEPERARRAHRSYLARAQWMTIAVY
jgi:hypothetical protein